jgi:hypothetical protein
MYFGGHSTTRNKLDEIGQVLIPDSAVVGTTLSQDWIDRRLRATSRQNGSVELGLRTAPGPFCGEVDGVNQKGFWRLLFRGAF